MPLSVDSLETLAKVFDSLADQARGRQDIARGLEEFNQAKGEAIAFDKAARVIRQTIIEPD